MERNVPNDFVSRYELVKHLVGVHDGWRIPFGYTVEDEIINFPAADVAPIRHGRWIPEYGSMDRVDYWHCSVCDSDFQYIGVTSLYDYCPNCGAKMDEGQDK